MNIIAGKLSDSVKKGIRTRSNLLTFKGGNGIGGPSRTGMRDPCENLLGRDRRQGLGDSERVCLHEEPAGIGADTVELIAAGVLLDMIVAYENDGSEGKGRGGLYAHL